MFYHPYISLSILVNYTDKIRISSCWLLLVALFYWSTWICWWYCSFGSVYLNLKDDAQYLLSICQWLQPFIQSRKNVTCSYFPPHLIHLHPQLFCLLVSLFSWLTEPVISYIRIYPILMIFWGFKLTCAVEPTAFYLSFMPLILLSRPSYFVLSVFLSMVLHSGDHVIFQFAFTRSHQ